MAGDFFGAPEVPEAVGTKGATSIGEDLANLKPLEGSESPVPEEVADELDSGHVPKVEEPSATSEATLKPKLVARAKEKQDPNGREDVDAAAETERQKNEAIQRLINMRVGKGKATIPNVIAPQEEEKAISELLTMAKEHFSKEQIGIMGRLLEVAVSQQVRPIAIDMAQKKAFEDAQAIKQIPNFEKHIDSVERVMSARPEMSMYDAYKQVAFDDVLAIATGKKVSAKNDAIAIKKSAQVEPGNMGVVKNLSGKSDSKALEEALGMGQGSDSAARNFFGVSGQR